MELLIISHALSAATAKERWRFDMWNAVDLPHLIYTLKSEKKK